MQTRTRAADQQGLISQRMRHRPETERQRQSDRESYRKTERHRETERERQRETETDRERERQTERGRESSQKERCSWQSWSSTAIKVNRSFPKTLNVELPHNPEIPLLGENPERNEHVCPHKACRRTFTAALLTRAPKSRQPRCRVHQLIKDQRHGLRPYGGVLFGHKKE